MTPLIIVPGQCDASPCSRCMGLVRKENARTGQVQCWNGGQPLTLDELVFFDISMFLPSEPQAMAVKLSS